ncbi:MipA/OmpV family protein [Salinarimonas soli]|uniref:MipA/OmpV family protein n=1 Tax=Salinarimonas soli TaxID=1638099 RepID=A0A5B2VXG5_9HYPH|nr:MipA/OmpV family protein [Salinarimonas soli]KAA2244031.1 hypothetical protein F0L46_01950 [Salinarimonas soli]
MRHAASASKAEAEAAARAGDDDDDTAPEGWTLEAGFGSFAAPRRTGSRRYAPTLVPLLERGCDDVLEASTREGVTYRVFDDGWLKGGPLLDIDEKNRPGTRAGNGLRAGRYGNAGEGAFGKADLGPATARLELSEGILARRGLKAEATLSRDLTLAAGLSLDYGLKLQGGDRLYTATTYGLLRARRGLGDTGAVPGLTGVGPTLSVRQALTETQSPTGTIEATRLVGAAAQSGASRHGSSRNDTLVGLSWQTRLSPP